MGVQKGGPSHTSATTIAAKFISVCFYSWAGISDLNYRYRYRFFFSEVLFFSFYLLLQKFLVKSLVDVSDIFIFSAWGEGKGESEVPGGEGEVRFLLKTQEGGLPGEVRGVGRGAGRVSA